MNAMDLGRGISMVVDSVVTNMNSRACNVCTSEEIAQIDQEREGKIDRPLPKNYLVIFDEIGMGLMDYYQYFEAHMIKSTSAYYSKKDSSWILEYSCSDYLLKGIS